MSVDGGGGGTRGAEPDAVARAALKAVEIEGGPRFRLWATCPGGLEREVAGELAALGWTPLQPSVREDVPRGRTDGLWWERGSVYGEADLAAVYRTLWGGRTIHRITALQHVGIADSLDEVEAAVRSADFSWLPDAPFAIRAARIGDHSFRSPDLGRVAGAAVIDEHRAATGRRLPVDLDDPEVEIRVELTGTRLRVGTELVTGSVHRRDYYPFRHMAALKPSVAAALLRLGAWKARESLLDPMCGGGTILVEAALALQGRPVRTGGTQRLERLGFHDPALARRVRDALTAPTTGRDTSTTLLGLERFGTHVGGARRNIRAAGVEEMVEVREGDATRPDGVQRVDCVVVNPPYGLRAGSPAILDELYQESLRALRGKLGPEGRIVFLSPAVRRVRRAAERAGLAVNLTRGVSLGRLDAVAFVLVPS